MTNRLTPLQLWDHIATSADDDVLRTADGVLLSEVNAGERIEEMQRLVRRAIASVPERKEARWPMIPRDPSARRELLRLLAGRGRYPGTQASVAFTAEEDLPDSGVEAELKRLLGRDENP